MRKKLANRLILVLVLATAIALVLVGCGGPSKQVDAPVLRFDNEKGIVNWDAVQNASGYVVRSNNEIFNVSEPNFKLSERGKYLIDVKALPESPKMYKASNYTRIEVTYTTKIAKPMAAITQYVGGDIKYIIANYDEYAKGYIISVGGKDYEVTKDRGIIDTNLEDNNYEVKIKGIGDLIHTTDSEVLTTNVGIRPVTLHEMDYHTLSYSDLNVTLEHKGVNIIKVDSELYELDPTKFGYNKDSGAFILDKSVLLSYAGDEPLYIDVHYVDGEVEVVKVNVIDEREPSFAKSNYITVYTGGDAKIDFDIYRYSLTKLETIKADGTTQELALDDGYTISYHLLRATVVVKAPTKDVDTGLLFTFTKKGNSEQVVTREVKYYFQETIPHVTGSHSTFNKAKGENISVAFDGGNDVTSVVLKHATKDVDYTIDNESDVITISKDYLSKYDAGAVVTGRAYFGSEYGTFTIHVLDDARTELNAFTKSEYTFESGSETSLVMTGKKPFTRSLAYRVSLDGIDVSKKVNIRDGNIVLSAITLNSLRYGFHELRVHMTGVTTYDVVATIHIVQPASKVPLGVSMSIDNYYPYISVTYVPTESNVTTYVTNVSSGKTYYATAGEDMVLVPYSEFDKGDKYTVSHSVGAVTGTTEEYTYEGFNVGNLEQFYKAKFTFGGKQYDAVMTSQEEFRQFMYYSFMRVAKMRAYDAIGKVTDKDDTMPWTLSASSNFEYSIRVYTPFISDNTSKSEIQREIDSAILTYKEPTSVKCSMSSVSGSNIWDIGFRVKSTNVPYHFEKEGHQPTATRYNYSYEMRYKGDGSRTTVFDDFAINRWQKTQSVYLSDELYYAIEDGARPVPVEGSPAERMYEKIKGILRNIVDDSMSEHEKYIAILDFINNNVTYDQNTLEYEKNLSSSYYRLIYPRRCFYLEGVFDDGIAVCNGLAKAVTVMAGIEGIHSMKVVGYTDSGQRHAWNKIKLDGIWYNTDPTWSSTLLSDAKVVDGLKAEGVNHNWALVDDKAFDKKHDADDRFNVVTSNIAFNFFANVTYDRDSAGNINSLIIKSTSDIDAIYNAVKDTANREGIISIAFKDANKVSDITLEFLNRFGEGWSAIPYPNIPDGYTIITLKYTPTQG